jgi:regulator of protease activity HflC (stomatin/prohibitin superfamily)
VNEKKALCVQGFIPLILFILLTLAIFLARLEPWFLIPIAPAGILWLKGLFIVSPNEGKILTFFGKYTGTVREPGFWFANPFASKFRISLKTSNFQSPSSRLMMLMATPSKSDA